MDLSPMPAQPGRRLKGGALVAFIAATVAMVAPAITEPNEGYRGKVYLDPAGYATQCFGEREIDPSRIYIRDECAAKLRVRMARDYAAPLIACVPDFADPRRQSAFGAAIDASYNAGPVAFCKSPMAKAFNAGDWAGGCSRFVGWYETARGKRYPGLVRRRKEEAAFCLRGVK